MKSDLDADKNRISDLRRLIDDESVMFDIGANIGKFSKELRSLSKNGIIYAFESISIAYNSLKKLKLGNRFHPKNLAISNETGIADFLVNESNISSSILKPTPNQSSKWLNFSEKIEVETKRLDDFIISEGLNSISLLKSDCEGFDLKVLESAGSYLRPDFMKSVLVEVSFHEFQDKYFDIFKLLSDKNYFFGKLLPTLQ